jgi:hypothetical protein
MVPVPTPPPQPFRWTLSSAGGAPPDRLGALTDGAEPPRLWYLPALTECAGKVLARAGGADLCFVGRSLDSMHDLLTGAFEGAPAPARPWLLRLPLSLRFTRRGWDPVVVRRLREHLAAVGLEPRALARRERPIALVDVVHGGSTYDVLHGALADWIEESREPWPVIRRKLRYVGVTIREKTSPDTWRWQQHTEGGWARTLPAGHVVNVSLACGTWGYFGNAQTKVQPSFPPYRWFDEDAAEPWRHDGLPSALAESLALVEAGRSRAVREELIRTIGGEPGFADRAVRALVPPLRGQARSRSVSRSGSRSSITGRSRSSRP